MTTKMSVENQINPVYPEGFDQTETKFLTFRNCIFNESHLFISEEAYVTRILFDSCIFNREVVFSATYFENGFVLNNCIFNATTQSEISSLSENQRSIELTNNISHAFFYFSDNFPNAPIIIKNNIFLGDTNLLDGSYLSLEVRDIDCVENNLGRLDVPLPQRYYPKTSGA
jgi:hypothetical protein